MKPQTALTPEKTSSKPQPEGEEDFALQATHRTGGSLPAEFWAFLKENKKWWLLPIVISVLGLGALVLLGGTAAAPFIYTLF